MRRAVEMCIASICVGIMSREVKPGVRVLVKCCQLYERAYRLCAFPTVERCDKPVRLEEHVAVWFLSRLSDGVKFPFVGSGVV